mgnify:CR=1 FL=1
MNKLKDLFKARWMSSLVFLILLFLITGIADHNFLTYSNIINCFNTATMYTLLAIGIAFVIMTGEIDVSIGATLGLTAAMTGLIAQSGGSIGKMLLICVAVGAAVGVVNGVGVAFFGVPSLIFTLGTNGLIRGLIYIVTDGRGLLRFRRTHQPKPPATQDGPALPELPALPEHDRDGEHHDRSGAGKAGK